MQGIKPDDVGTYRGICEKRRGEEITVITTGCLGMVAVRFPDGFECGIAPASFERPEPVQLAKAA